MKREEGRGKRNFQKSEVGGQKTEDRGAKGKVNGYSGEKNC